MVADNRRYHGALIDPLPVGYECQNMRDNRAEAFTSLLWEGSTSIEWR